MKMNRNMGLCAAGLCLAAQAVWAAEVEAGFRSLFNGTDLTGWAGRPQHWSVQAGAITGTTTKETPAQGNNFLIARDGDKDLAVGDFELRCSFKFTGDWGNSGIQYRSQALPNFVVHGYQADMETGPNYSGILYEEGGRGILCERGQKVVIKDDPANPGKPKIEVVGSLGDAKQIGAAIDAHQWSDYVVIARGNHLQHFINGRQTVDMVDEQSAKAAQSGILALQLHGGPPMKIQFKNVRIKPLSAATPVSDLQRLQGTWQAESLVRDGETVPKADLAGARVRVEGNRFFIEGDADASEGTFDLVEGGPPKAMNVTTAGGDLARAIYEVTDDTLKVCYAADGGSRPSEFKSEAYSGRVLAVYKKAKPAKTASELERVQGTWQAESLVRDGEAVSKSDLAGLRVRIEGNRFFITGEENASEGTFELVEGGPPKAMNVTTAGGDLARAIYEVTDDTLKVCYAADGGSRPGEFKSEAYSGRVLAVYKKSKPAKTASELERIQGTWQAESLVRDGETVAKSDLASLRVRIEGNRFFITGEENASEGTFELVEGGPPKAMNVTTAGGDLARAIYEVTDDTLKVCYAADGGSRPSEFKSEAYSGRVLAVYKKAKSTN